MARTLALRLARFNALLGTVLVMVLVGLGLVAVPDRAVALDTLLLEESDTRLAYTGTWATWNNPSLSGGSYRGIGRASGTASVAFTGTAIEWVTCTNSNQGIAKVVLDGVEQSVDLYSPTLVFRSTVFSKTGLEPGSHTLTIRWTGQKNAASTGTDIGVDAFSVTGSLTQATAPDDVPREAPRVYLDPGHGGTDPGAVDGTSNDSLYTEEEDVNLAVALRLQAALIGNGFEVIMSRCDDTYPTLQQRADEANAWGADIFVSIHSNAATVETARGIEILQGSVADKALADVLYPYLEVVSPWADRGVKYRDSLRVLNSTTMPSVVIECGFVTNTQEEAFLVTDGYQARLAEQILAGVAAWFGVPDGG